MKNTEPANPISKKHGRINNDSRRPKAAQTLASTSRPSVGRAKANAASVGAGNKRTERQHTPALAPNMATTRAKKAPHIRLTENRIELSPTYAKALRGFAKDVCLSPDQALNGIITGHLLEKGRMPGKSEQVRVNILPGTWLAKLIGAIKQLEPGISTSSIIMGWLEYDAREAEHEHELIMPLVNIASAYHEAHKGEPANH